MPQINYTVKPSNELAGEFRVPGDKSISHRSIIFGSIADGTTHVSGFLQGEDSLNTLRAFRAMGVKIEGPNASGEVTIKGVGIDGLKKPAHPIDLGNSGTSIRLMSGLLSGQSFDVELCGDRSLSKRPMKRVTDPLALMGAEVNTVEGGYPPLKIKGGSSIKGIEYPMPMASAQVKSCILLAGIYAQGETCVIEPATTRDHTERMLNAFNYPVKTQNNKMCIEGGGRLTACDIDVPADISSAAFFLVGASIAKKADITLLHVGVNPTRTGVIDILKLMGANIELLNECLVGGEPVADIRVKSTQLKGIDVPENLVPLAIDEFPALFVAAACAEGKTTITGAEELRVKESDRIQVMADGLQAIGVDAIATDDGMIIRGGAITGGTVHSCDDHRIAMAFTMAALHAESDIIIEDCKNVSTSFPDFIGLANRAGINLAITE
ncbi:3-phosphoshikimate 1-carboxyvinyltransferase [hydrothermal vent metagenome]|uniref:3-phosphoshikimate 1-carboxyvinyltransferase n=1 Tax=hydrothermal vent metagenome TaxID=652676 RepID=A0A3B0XJS2_9ZZZZ